MIVEEDTKNRAVQHKSIWDKGAVWQTFNALKEVNRPEEIDWKAIPSMQPVAWKTGTSYGFRDAWAVGVTPRLCSRRMGRKCNRRGKARN